MDCFKDRPVLDSTDDNIDPVPRLWRCTCIDDSCMKRLTCAWFSETDFYNYHVSCVYRLQVILQNSSTFQRNVTEESVYMDKNGFSYQYTQIMLWSLKHLNHFKSLWPCWKTLVYITGTCTVIWPNLGYMFVKTDNKVATSSDFLFQILLHLL